MEKFRDWLISDDGLKATDPWNIWRLSKVVIDGAPIDFGNNMKECVLYLISIDRKPITSYGENIKWVETFFEKGNETTLYDDIMQQVYGSGDRITENFWIGTRLPTNSEVKIVMAFEE